MYTPYSTTRIDESERSNACKVFVSLRSKDVIEAECSLMNEQQKIKI